MADSWTPDGSSTTVRVLSQTEVIDAQSIGIITKPSGVRVRVQVPLADFRANRYKPYLDTTATLIEGVLDAEPDPGQKLATAATYSEDTDDAGLLAAFISFLVSYSAPGVLAPPYTETVTFPLARFETAAAFEVEPSPIVTLTNAYGRLKRLADS